MAEWVGEGKGSSESAGQGARTTHKQHGRGDST